jgi:hypothetical protein
MFIAGSGSAWIMISTSFCHIDTLQSGLRWRWLQSMCEGIGFDAGQFHSFALVVDWRSLFIDMTSLSAPFQP